MKNVTEMSTKEIVAEFNALTGKDTKRFATRAAAEKALTKARDAKDMVDATGLLYTEQEAQKLTDEIVKPYHYSDGCPKCGMHDQVPAGAEGETGSDRLYCNYCDTEYYENGKIYKEPKPSATRSASIAESWNNVEVADARSRRHTVHVKGEIKKGHMINQDFGSVPKAFKELGLDHKKMIAFRLALVKAGKLDFAGFTFTIIKSE